MKPLTIVKLGGSVITHKRESPPRVHDSNISRIAEELKSRRTEMVVVLGGGAHGHQAAHDYGFDDPTTHQSRLIEGIPIIRHNMSLLSLRVEEELNRHDAHAVVIPPFTQATIKEGRIHAFPVELIQMCLDAGFLVITHGDVCFEVSGSASILSGDTIVTHLTKHLGATKVFIGTDVDGIYDSNPRTSSTARLVPVMNQSNIEKMVQQSGPSSSTDVTGGMGKKASEIVALARTKAEVIVFNLSIPGRLSSLLSGNETICTRVAFD